MKKKIMAIAIVVVMLSVVIVGGSLAYFTDETDVAQNVFTVGNVMIELDEPAWTETGSVDAPDVYPGEALDKDPTVSNVGANPCFVRVSVEGLDCLGDNLLITTESDNDANGDGLDDNWVYDEETGYYYYTKVLCAPGTEGESWNEGLEAVTTALFDRIRIPTELTNDDDVLGETEFSVDVFAQAVQAQGAKPKFADVKTMTVDEIIAWFETCIPAPQA